MPKRQNGQKNMNRTFVKWGIRLTGLLIAGTFIFLSYRYFHLGEFLANTQKFFFENPLILLVVTFSYLFSFLLRAEAWRLYLGKSVRFSSCLQGVFLSLFINHISPFKVGDAVRVGILSWREKNIKPEISAHSVVVLRIFDMVFLVLFSLIGLLAFSKTFIFRFSLGFLLLLSLLGLILIFILYKYRPSFVSKHIIFFKEALSGRNLVTIVTLIALSWALEGAVVWGVTKSLGQGLPLYKAIWVNSLTVGGQVFQITPGGISTYESVMTAALTSFHYPVKDGYMVALVSHSFKFIFSYIVGFVLLIRSPITRIKQIKTLLLKRGKQE
ncbi:lysylphosphatidylglycerol synthase transmembrane domain-containing protein [Neobacillus drentensis]